jgi:guanosine-3',5'-bis(diphosphate) 3'-pyrophosphohydrolase
MAQNNTDPIHKALIFAEKAHSGQFRRDGKPYFTHVEAVANKVLMDWFQLIPYEAQVHWNKHKDHVVAAAALHDVIEDCGITKEQLLEEGFSVMTVEIVDALSKRSGETYFDFIMRIHNGGAFRVGMVAVKLADLAHNISDNPKKGSLLDKYRLAEYILSYFNEK